MDKQKIMNKLDEEGGLRLGSGKYIYTTPPMSPQPYYFVTTTVNNPEVFLPVIAMLDAVDMVNNRAEIPGVGIKVTHGSIHTKYNEYIVWLSKDDVYRLL